MSLNKNWSSLIKPSKLTCESLFENNNIAEIVVEPLERGFGLTIANALRRILLSSLQGSAVTSVKIPGVVHEFSAIPGVKEDLCDIVLNLKSLSIKMHNTDKKTVRLKASGPCIVTAEMIEANDSVEILDPKHVICTLGEGANLEMELTCETGRGYVPVSPNNDEDIAIGVIPIDALFSPVKKVSYTIKNTRVGQVTNYDKLIMNIETNGTVTPEIAVALAARILQDQLQLFITFKEEVEEKTAKLEELPFHPILLTKVEELDLTVRSQNCLKTSNITYIGDLVSKSENEMLRTPNFGRKSLTEIREKLSIHGLSLGAKLDTWPPENIEELAKKFEEPY